MRVVAKKRRRQRLRPPLVDDERRVVRSALCVRCGTDVVGSSLDDDCPACAHPVYDSLYGAFLIDAPPEHSRRVYRMSTVILVPSVLLSSLALVGILLTLATSRNLNDAVLGTFDVCFFFALVAQIISMVGVAVFTGRHTAEYYAARMQQGPFARRVVVAVVVMAAVVFSLALFGGPYGAATMQVGFAAIPMGVFLLRFG
ncbi:hypothetical protein GF395_04585, partial [Candidatus Uhrbacteria bacterium]|nr:hypothetical protein [Candidatus Uhrbacteria bacterium]